MNFSKKLLILGSFDVYTRMKDNQPVHNIGYHFVWCPKYRRSVLEGAVYERTKQLIREKCEQMEIQAIELEVMPDHVHIFLKANSRLSPHTIASQIKGYTSKILRDEFPEIRSRLPTLWTRSYYCESVGSLRQEDIERYIQNQKNV